MRSQSTSSGNTWPVESVVRNGVAVAGGYGVGISVWRGRLRVDDGIGQDRRSRIFHRATSGLKRLVVLGHTGYVSLEGIRWLADVKAAYLQVDADGRVLASYGAPGTDRPSLRRAQALASQSGQAIAHSRWLVDAKLAGQITNLGRFGAKAAVDEAVDVIETNRHQLAAAETVDDLRLCEAFAAAAYWQALAHSPVRFAHREVDQIPSLWRTFGGRSSPMANGPRMAANPANAVLNYLYSLLEGEATLAARIVGLDPGLGVMHADQPHRDSLAADLMEPVRPMVDAYAFELLATRPFMARNFHETRTGVCRVTAPLTHELAETIPHWGKLVGKVAEDLAHAIEARRPRTTGTTTPITGRNRAESRPAGPRTQRSRAPRTDPTCSWCGGPTERDRRTCGDECESAVKTERLARMTKSSSLRMKRLAAMPGHPARTPEANERRRRTRMEQRRAELAWEHLHTEPIDRARFGSEIMPRLRGLSATALARATGMSTSYWAAIKRGERVPHPRWWEHLLRLADRLDAT